MLAYNKLLLFLHENVQSLNPWNVAIVASSFITIYSSYWVCEYLLTGNEYYDGLPHFRKRYVIKNLIKAVYLYVIAFFATFAVKDMFLYNIWNNQYVKVLGLMYCLPDFIALFRVPKLHQSTIQHHITTTLFAILNLFNDYKKDNHWRGLIVYAYLSMLTGIVNYYLGYRLISGKERSLWKTNMAKSAFFIYSGSLLINWLYQVYIVIKWIGVFPLWGLYVYMVMIGFVVYDDIYLIRFLYRESVLGVEQNKVN